jgi:hypothetical protein
VLNSFLNNWFKYFSKLLGVSAVLGLSSPVVLAELSAEHKQRVRGEMREIWSKMTPEERDSLQREYATTSFEAEAPAVPMQKTFVRGSDKPRQFSTEDHHHLRRQLKDISGDVKH